MRQIAFKALGIWKVKMGIVTGCPVYVVVHRLLQVSMFSLKTDSQLLTYSSLTRTAIQILQRFTNWKH